MATWDVDEWLGAMAGGVALPENCVTILTAGFQANPPVWEEDDVKEDDVVLDG